MKKILAVSLYLAPALVFAQDGPQLTNIEELIRSIGRLVGLLIPIVVAIALLLFFWGLARFILAAGDEGARESGRNLMIWGIIAFVVMLSVWGLVAFVQSSFGLDPNAAIEIPGVELPA